MRAIKNFIYNSSDIFVAIIIVAIAVVLIVTRIDVIMDYPDASKDTSSVVDTQSADTETSLNLDPSQKYIEVSIPAGSSTDVVAGLLKEAGAISDTEGFMVELQAMGKSGSLNAGTHYIPEGCTLEEMINILCGVSVGYSVTDAGAGEGSAETPAQ